jgi:hypothetical protein
MMRWNTFARGAVFAAVVAAGWLPWVVTVGAIVGAWNALVLYLVAALACAVAGMGPPGPRRFSDRRLGGAFGAGLLGCGVAVVATTTTELCLGLAVVLGLARSVFLYRAAPARAVMTEAVLLIGGLWFARFLAGPTLVSTAFAIWGFWLVQSCYFLIAGIRARAPARGDVDPFEHACQRATALLDRAGV